MSRARDWEKARERDLARVRGAADSLRRPPRKAKGISSKQAEFLAKLQKDAGVAYSGNGMTAAEASREIEKLTGVVRPQYAVERRKLADRVEHLERDLKALSQRLERLEQQS